MAKKIEFYTEWPDPSVLEEHMDVPLSYGGREIVEEAEAITYYKSLPRWKRMANVAINSLITLGLAYPSVHGADNYIIPKDLRK
jgi:hypothetical protein